MFLEEADLVVKNGTILPLGQLGTIERGLIAVKDGIIVYAGKLVRAPKFRTERIIEGRGKLVMPGLVNCHTHLPMTLFRGLAEERELDDWLNQVIWPLEKKLKPHDIHVGSLLGCLEMIKSGTTCFADMYFFEPTVAEAVEKAGLRAALAAGIVECADLRDMGENMFNDAVDFARKYRGYAGGRVTTFLGPHAVFSCSADLLEHVSRKASELGVGVHMHVAESEKKAVSIRKTFGVSEIGLLERTGLLKSNLLAAHCIHLTRKDIVKLVQNDVKVAHNPTANMKLAQGVAKIKEFLDSGTTVGIGTDGAASNNSLDMFESMKVAALLQKANLGDPTALPSRKVLEMATINGAKALGLEREIGSLEVGKRADMILVDLKQANLVPLHDVQASLVYSAHGCNVASVIVDGRILMEDRRVRTIDEEKILDQAEDVAHNILQR